MTIASRELLFSLNVLVFPPHHAFGMFHHTTFLTSSATPHYTPHHATPPQRNSHSIFNALDETKIDCWRSNTIKYESRAVTQAQNNGYTYLSTCSHGDNLALLKTIDPRSTRTNCIGQRYWATTHAWVYQSGTVFHIHRQGYANGDLLDHISNMDKTNITPCMLESQITWLSI